MAERAYPASIGYYDTAAGTIYVSDRGFVTRPVDSPANTHMAPRVKLPASLRRDIIAPGRTILGRTQARYGDVVITNPDGALDGWFDYAFDGREFVQYVGDFGSVFPTGYTRLVTATMDEAAFTEGEIRIKLRDRVGELDKPVQTTLYAGTGTLEGSSELTGKPKPMLYGYKRHIRPPLVDSSRLIYHINSTGDSVTLDYGSGFVVFENGVGIPQDTVTGATYSDQADMLANAPAAGTFRVWPAGGYIRLGSSPSGVITCHASTTVDTVGAFWAAITALAATDNVASGIETALDAANAGTIGLWIGPDEEPTMAEVLDRALGTIGGWCGTNNDGELTAGVLKDPSNQTATYTFPTGWLDNLRRVPVADSFGGVPCWRARMKWDEKIAFSDSEIAGSISDGGRAELKQSHAVAIGDSDSSILTKHPLAPDLLLDSLFTSSAVSPSAEAERQFNLRSVKRDRFAFRAPMRSETEAIDLGQYVRIVHPRFGLSAGKNFVIATVAPDTSTGMIDFEVWG